MRLSVIIANYNYGAFVGAAIASALAIDWPDKEVIVVDDASTDNSRTVIEGFGGKVAAYFQPKSHQLGAHKFGFEQSTGDVVILLDADDMLEPEVMREIAAVWRPSVSLVQYRLALIDADSTPLGTAFPQFSPKASPEELRRTYLRTMGYTTSPGSGNAYSRDCARQAFAMVPPTMRQSDAPLVGVAPLLGDVLTIHKPLARYRIHSANNFSLTTFLDAAKIRQSLQSDLEQVSFRETLFRNFNLPIPSDPLSRSFGHLQNRFASYLVEPSAHPFPEDTIANLLYRFSSRAITFRQTGLRNRMILLAWAFACVLSPRRYRRNLILWRIAPLSRPATIKKLLGALETRCGRSALKGKHDE